MIPADPSPEYLARLREVLASGDWEALREFALTHNQIPGDVAEQDRHFWEVLLHKLICNRVDMLSRHPGSRAWLDANGYTTDLGGY